MALSYSVKGQGEAVLWLHGLAMDSWIWEDFTEKMPNTHKHILLDMPGFGKSTESEAPKSIEAIATQVKATLDSEGITQVSVVGHSMGGYVALALIELYPGLVTRLCMFHSQPYADDNTKKADRKKLITFIEKNGTKPWMKEFYTGLFAEESKIRLASTIQLLFDTGIQYDQKSVINTIEALMNRPDRTASLKNFTGPVLFIVGKQDAAIATENSLTQLDIPDISFVEILDSVAHMGIFEAPSETKIAINELLLYPIQ